MSDCVFCDSVLEVVEQSEYSIALYDKFPVSQGHTLIIPKNHYKTYFDLPVEVRNDMLVLLDAMKQKLDKELKPSGYNIGINSGASAGQTVFHCHIHLIPRYNGDMDNPDGGVRGVIPEKQKY
jgi:diadenosine tetraphosphate (Ap4A) HIT family hydrolase